MSDPLSDIEQAALQNREQIVKALEIEIANLETHVGERPRVLDPLNGNVVMQWRDRTNLYVGKISGMLQMAGMVRLLPQEQVMRLKVAALTIIARAQAEIIAGQSL